MISLDTKIRSLRVQFNRSKEDEEAMALLREIDALQKQRFKEQGAFLPIVVNGIARFFYFDTSEDMQRWFEFPAPKVS